MPQLLYYIGIDNSTKMRSAKAVSVDNSAAPHVNDSTKLDSDIFINNKHEDIDFGTLDVYTCPLSCNSGLAFVEEQVFVILPPAAKL